jgi:hypothetical protein
VSELSLFNANSAILLSYIKASTSKLSMRLDDGEVCFVLDLHAGLNLHSASTLKQQSVRIHVAPLGHIILIPSQPVFVLSP